MLAGAEKMQPQIPGSRIVSIDNSNHFTSVTNDILAESITRFLAE